MSYIRADGSKKQFGKLCRCIVRLVQLCIELVLTHNHHWQLLKYVFESIFIPYS